MPDMFASSSRRRVRAASPPRTTLPDALRVCPGAPKRRVNRAPVLTPEQLQHIAHVNSVFWGHVNDVDVNVDVNNDVNVNN